MMVKTQTVLRGQLQVLQVRGQRSQSEGCLSEGRVPLPPGQKVTPDSPLGAGIQHVSQPGSPLCVPHGRVVCPPDVYPAPQPYGKTEGPGVLSCWVLHRKGQ